MVENKTYYIGKILILAVIMFILFPVSTLSAQELSPIIIQTTSEEEPVTRTVGRFEEVIKFFELFSYEGVVEHEHEYTFWGGGSGFYGRGSGTLYGTQTALEKITSLGRTYSSSKSYFVHTYPGLARAESMGAVSGFSIRNSHSGTLGVRPNAGEDASINSTVDYSRDQGGADYFKHGSSVSNTDGTTTIKSEAGGSDTTAEVEGTAVYYEKVVVDKGGQKTGWWDMN